MSEKLAAAFHGASFDVPGLILQGIRDFQASRPRSLQVEVGPSQLGNPCDHCLAAALAGWEKGNDDAWLPLIGIAMHELLLVPQVFGNGWLKEHRVTVGRVAGVEVAGNADLFHAPSGTVIDLKIVGASTLNEARRHGSKAQYKRQINLYGKGFADTYGYDVNTVIIAYLPRNSPRLSDAFFDIQPYDEDVAVETLHRADELAFAVKLYGDVSVKARDVFIDGLPRSPGCYDCARYPGLVRPASELQQYSTTTRVM